MSVCIGLIQNKHNELIQAVSASDVSGKQALDLAEKYLDENDPERLDLKFWGVLRVIDKDYVNITKLQTLSQK